MSTWNGSWIALNQSNSSVSTSYSPTVQVVLLGYNPSSSKSVTINYTVGGNAPVSVVLNPGNQVAVPTIIAAGGNNLTVSVSTAEAYVAMVYPGCPLPTQGLGLGGTVSLNALTGCQTSTGNTYEQFTLTSAQGASTFVMWVGSNAPQTYAVNWDSSFTPQGYSTATTTANSTYPVQSNNYYGQQVTIFNTGILNSVPTQVTNTVM